MHAKGQATFVRFKTSLRCLLCQETNVECVVLLIPTIRDSPKKKWSPQYSVYDIKYLKFDYIKEVLASIEKFMRKTSGIRDGSKGLETRCWHTLQCTSTSLIHFDMHIHTKRWCMLRCNYFLIYYILKWIMLTLHVCIPGLQQF